MNASSALLALPDAQHRQTPWRLRNIPIQHRRNRPGARSNRHGYPRSEPARLARKVLPGLPSGSRSDYALRQPVARWPPDTGQRDVLGESWCWCRPAAASALQTVVRDPFCPREPAPWRGSSACGTKPPARQAGRAVLTGQSGVAHPVRVRSPDRVAPGSDVTRPSRQSGEREVTTN